MPLKNFRNLTNIKLGQNIYSKLTHKKRQIILTLKQLYLFVICYNFNDSHLLILKLKNLSIIINNIKANFYNYILNIKKPH